MGEGTVGEIGEIELVSRILNILAADAVGADVVRVGPGDDAAVLSCHGDVVVTTDSQHQGVHFQVGWIGAQQLGRRAIAVNASDLGAMGAQPTGFLAALALPRSVELTWVEDLARGLAEGARRYGATVVGGDVAAVTDHISINVTAVGERPRHAAAGRAGARPGHRLLMTGWPGRAAAGMRLLEANVAPPDEAARRCVDAFREPMPPVQFGIAAVRHGLVAAMLDVSDGIALDLRRLCRSSRVGARLDAAALRGDETLAAVAARLSLDPTQLLLAGGEDYELLCAAGDSAVDELLDLAEEHGVTARVLGTVVDADEGLSVVDDGVTAPLPEGGWDPFGERRG
jgi:thiamine-monophosphate kinase